MAGQGVPVHAVVLGPVDTDMNRGFNIPKVSTESAAVGIFDGLERGEDEIFPDPVAQSIAEGWRAGVSKALERQFSAFAPKKAAEAARLRRLAREGKRLFLRDGGKRANPLPNQRASSAGEKIRFPRVRRLK